LAGLNEGGASTLLSVHKDKTGFCNFQQISGILYIVEKKLKCQSFEISASRENNFLLLSELDYLKDKDTKGTALKC